MKFKISQSLLISFGIGFIITFAILFDNLIIGIKYNEYGIWGVLLFCIVFFLLFIVFSGIAYVIYVIIYLIINSIKKHNNVK